MKRTWFALLFGWVILALSVPAFAAIDNTHHELQTYQPGGSGYTCFACHGYPQPAGTGSPLLGRVGNFCYIRCHAGGTAAFPIGAAAVQVITVGTIGATDNVLATAVGAANGLEALTNGHGLDWGSMNRTMDALAAPAWPYNDKDGGGDMECTTCHDVHNNSYAPFLRAPLSAQATTNEHADMSAVTDTFCIKCHTGGTSGANRYNVITAIPNGTHPVEMTTAGVSWTGTAKLASWTAVAPFAGARAGRTIDLKGTIFEQTTAWGTALNGAALNSWNLGGKLGGTSDNVVGCYTCHQVHMNKNLTAPTGQTYKNLTVMPYSDNNAKTATNDDLCLGCHGATASLANPGTTGFYHPTGSETDNTVTGAGTSSASYTVSTGTFDIIVDMTNKQYGSGGRLLCTSCHAPAHAFGANAVAGSMMMSPNAPNGCASCHNTAATSNFNAANSHHVSGTTTDYTNANPAYPNPSWMAGNATLADGLQCWDCHNTAANSTAHNWQ